MFHVEHPDGVFPRGPGRRVQGMERAARPIACITAVGSSVCLRKEVVGMSPLPFQRVSSSRRAQCCSAADLDRAITFPAKRWRPSGLVRPALGGIREQSWSRVRDSMLITASTHTPHILTDFSPLMTFMLPQSARPQ